MPQIVVSRPLVPSRSVVEDEGEKQGYWDALLCDWYGPARSIKHRHFPGCNPISVSRAMLPRLHAGDYSVALKSDGVRYVLYCTTRPGSTEALPLPVALMIDRARNMYEVDVVAQEDVFLKRTILEGELVWKQPEGKTMLFLVFDCVLSHGVHYVDRPFRERIAEVDRAVRLSEELSVGKDVDVRVQEMDNVVMMQYDPRIAMRGKVFVDRDHAARLWEGRMEAGHRVDGLVLHDNGASYVFGRSASVLKWKDASTVDLAGPSLLTLHGRALPSTVCGRRLSVAVSRVVPRGEGDVVEYVVDAAADKVVLFALRTRPDKTAANSLEVVLATVQDVVEAVVPAELQCSAAH